MKAKRQKIKSIDEWGDKGTWVTIADFTKRKKGGVLATEILKALRQVSVAKKP